MPETQLHPASLTMPTPTGKKILIIVHQEHSNPGLVGDLLRTKGYTLDIRRTCLQETLPATMDEHDGVVIFGGPMSANDDEQLPFIRTELDWIPIALDANKPFLGICLGAQLLARSLGARVAPHSNQIKEIGYASLAPTSAGEAVLGGLTHVYHWHGEGFELPNNAVLLATGDVFPHQAFCYGARAYGVQFHPEITKDLIELWTTKAADQLELPNAQSREEQLQKHNTYGSSVERWLEGFLDRWLETSQSKHAHCA